MNVTGLLISRVEAHASNSRKGAGHTIQINSTWIILQFNLLTINPFLSYISKWNLVEEYTQAKSWVVIGVIVTAKVDDKHRYIYYR